MTGPTMDAGAIEVKNCPQTAPGAAAVAHNALSTSTICSKGCAHGGAWH